MKQNRQTSDCRNSSDKSEDNAPKNAKDLKTNDCCNTSQDCDCGKRGCDCDQNKKENANSTSDNSAHHQKPKRYKCKNCGTIHDCGTPPKSCCKCDCTDFKEI